VTRLRKLTQCWLAGVLALLLAVLAARTVAAHAEYERSEPAADSVVTQAPAQLRLWFTQDLFRRQGVNRIEVYDESGQRVDQDDPVIDDDNRRLLTVTLARDLPDGVYTVRWFSLSSEDGHEGEGEFSFTVDSGGGVVASEAVTTAGEISATAAITASVAVSPSAASEPAEEPPPTIEPTAAEPTAAPASPSSGLPCLGGAALLVLAIGLVLTQRRT
jgi:methionine-rich copper-binding protein CopC